MDPVTTASIAAAGLGLANTGYNLWTNKRDFDYQKALQQTIFQREDTAVQRRKEDLMNAGLNPNLAAGSAAGAGSVVSRSSTNDVNMGSALDMLQAVNQIKLQKQEQANKAIENEILNTQMNVDGNNRTLSEMKILHQLGFGITPYMKNGHLTYYYYDDPNQEAVIKPGEMKAKGANQFFKMLDNDYTSSNAAAKLMEGEAGWQGVQNTIGIIGKLLGIFK